MASSSKGTIVDTSGLCGQTVVSLTGSPYPAVVTGVSDTDCVAKGKAAIGVIQVDSLPSALLQIDQGRAIAALWGPENIAFQMSVSPGKYVALGDIFQKKMYGVFVNKDNSALAKVIQSGVNAMMTDGTYATILKKWGLDGSALPSSTINGATY